MREGSSAMRTGSKARDQKRRSRRSGGWMKIKEMSVVMRLNMVGDESRDVVAPTWLARASGCHCRVVMHGLDGRVNVRHTLTTLKDVSDWIQPVSKPSS